LIDSFFTNVPVYPTEEQINAATQNILFDEIENPLNSSCPIFLDPFQPEDTVIQIRYCRHNFTEASLRSWFRSNVGCPVCRYDIRNYNVDTNDSSVEEDNENNKNNDNDVNSSSNSNNQRMSHRYLALEPESADESDSNASPRRNRTIPGVLNELTSILVTQMENQLQTMFSSPRSGTVFNSTGYTYDPSNNAIVFTGNITQNPTTDPSNNSL